MSYLQKILKENKDKKLREAIARFNDAKNVNVDACPTFTQLLKDEEMWDSLSEAALTDRANKIKPKGYIHSKRPTDFPPHRLEAESGSHNRWFKVKDKNGNWRYYQAIISRGGTFTFREASSGYSVADTMDREGANKVLATIVFIIQRYVVRKKPDNLSFTSADPGRTLVYRRLARLFAEGYFNTRESGVLAPPRGSQEPFKWTHSGSPFNDNPGVPLANPEPASVGSAIWLISTKKKGMSRILPRSSSANRFTELPTKKAERWMKRGDSSFSFTAQGQSKTEVPLSQLADLPPKTYVVAVKLRGEPLRIVQPVGFDEKTQRAEIENDVGRVRSAQATFNREFKKAQASGDQIKINKAMSHPGARIEIRTSGAASRLIKELFKLGVQKPPTVTQMNPPAFHRWVDSLVKK